MKWRIKDKTVDDYIHRGFAWLPTTVNNYKYWLETYWYYKLAPDYASDSCTRIKFGTYQDCYEAVTAALHKGDNII